MLNLSNALQEQLEDVSDDALMQYMSSISKWLKGYTEEEALTLLSIIKKEPALLRSLQSQVKQEMGSTIKCYRTITFSNKKIKVRKALLGPNPKQGSTYKLESYKKRAMFSWTTDREFAFNWQTPDKMKLSWIMSKERYIFEALIPYNMVVFAMDMWGKWNEWLHVLKKRGMHGGSKKHSKRYKGIKDMLDTFNRQHEVIVWHKMPIQAKLIDKYITSDD